MKLETNLGLLCPGIMLLVMAQLHAADGTKPTVSTQESWETISNRWATVPIGNIKDAAEKADISAQYYLAIASQDGIGIVKDERESFKWMRMAATGGRPQAQRKLGLMFENGWGTATNETEAVRWFAQAAQQGDAPAQVNLGWMYANGVGVFQDYTEAAKYYRQAAEAGNAMAENNFGWCCFNGFGVPRDAAEALRWYQKSADQAEPLGEKNLAWMYAQGAYGKGEVAGQGADWQVRSGGNAPNHELAEHWMRQAVDLKSAEGQYEYGNLLINEVDKDGFQDTNSFPAAATWFQKAAAQGAAKAQYQLAEMYHTGKLGDDQRSNCVAWFLKAAAQGYVEAQAQIGTLPQFYPNSELLKSADPIDMLQKAAAQDNLDSEFDLAFRYHKGDGVPKDPALAFHWMEKAAQHDISPVTRTIDSHYYLGLMYETGEGVATNLVKAFQLYQAAAVAGNKPDPFFHLARMYETGAGGIQDDRQAAENYYQATQFGFFPGSDDTARRGSIEGLANLYAQGRGMPGDKTIAARQVNELKAGSLLTAKTYFLLGEMYAQGRPVSPDLAEAAAWLRLASLQKVAGAAGELEKVQAEMSPAQNSTAQRRFDDLNRTMRVAIYAYGQAANYRDSHSW